ncbi:SagB/ThcOx family dehydrogenase [Microbispora sp. NPDC046933]|uniref:SagB/ThcOx family dehydrogenase n=1 Tax=Microbispora sp. NPDC046933 TaxID=3155618 RepID=UPI0033D70CEF
MEGGLGRRYVEVGENLPIPDEVDWAGAPRQFKLYDRGLPRTPLGYDRPRAAPGSVWGFEQAGQLLADVYGLTRQRWTASDALRWIVGTRGSAAPSGYRGLAMNTLRPVPSGGARFPGELYVVAGPGECLPTGVHHYDPAHHALVTLRTGDHRLALARALGLPAGEAPRLTLLLSVFFWKNAFKYGELSYRLCGLDLGALIGQTLAVTGRYERRVRVRYRFLDDDLDGLLGLDPGRESVYVAITVDTGRRTGGPLPAEPATVAPEPVPAAGTSGSGETWSLEAFPLPARLHRAARMTDPAALGHAAPVVVPGPVRSLRSVPLPERRADLLAGLRRRRSSMGYFERRELSLDELADLLGATAGGYSSDIGDGPGSTLLFCAVNHVSGLRPGVYCYRPRTHALEQIRDAEIGDELQASLLVRLFNLSHTSLCVYPVAAYESGLGTYGDRWYRIQNMEAGILLQRLYLASAALGLKCHANLGYSVRQTNRLLGLEDGPLTSLIQIMIGGGREPGDYYEHECL